MAVFGTVVINLHPEGSDTRPVYGLVTDDLGDAKILLSYSDMKDWGILWEDFPKVPPTKTRIRKVTTPRKSTKVHAARKRSPTVSPRKDGHV